jgi:hypothetical protein
MKSLILLVSLLFTHDILANSFSVKIGEPNVDITIPELPQMKMKKHPLASVKPHLRLMGSSGGYNVSVITPTADKGMTALECASSRISSLMKRYSLKESQFQAMKADDKNTFVMYFPLKVDKYIQLNAYLLSAHDGSYCIEVHISKMTQEIDDVINWHKSFPDARIKSY